MADWDEQHARNKGRAAKAFGARPQPTVKTQDKAMDILTAMKARSERQAAKEIAAHERNRTVPKPQLTPTGTLRRDGDAVGRAALKSSAQEKQEQAEKMKAALQQQRQPRSIGRDQ